MAIARKDETHTDYFTYGLYRTWDDGQRWELIRGEAWCMSPGASLTHQRISFELGRQFGNYLKGKPCKALSAPFDVLLPDYPGQPDDDIATVVQPDLFVVCDRSKLNEKGCKGAPDLVVEILSPSTAQRDMREKFNLYEQAGVQEYWVVQPADKTVLVFHLLADGGYGRHQLFAGTEPLPVPLLGDLVVELAEVFAE